MKVSVIMPVYNGERYLSEAIASVLAQTLATLELIVIDDGSTDGSRAIVAQLADARVRYVWQENGGVSAARNRGILLSDGALIAFLDQDDRWTPDALAKQVAWHTAHPDCAYTLAHQRCFLAQGVEMPAWFRLQKLDVPHVGHMPGTLAVKRPIFDSLGLFDTAYPISSDADWFARASDAALPTAVLPDVILQRRIHANNQSRFSKTIQAELLQLLRASIKRKQQAA